MVELPFILQYHITNKCNLNCRHCYKSQGNENKIKLSFFKKIVNDFISLTDELDVTNLVRLSGGEPFLHPKILDMVNFLNKNDIKIDTVTNGTVQTEFKELSKIDKINITISIDGDKKTHNKIRGENYSKTINTLNKLKENNISTSISFTLLEMNKDSIDHVLKLARKYDSTLEINRFIPSGNGGEMKSQMLTGGDLEKIYDKLKDVSNVKINEKPLWNIFKGKKELAGCPAGFKLLSIDPEGNVYPCGKFKLEVGNLYENNLRGIFFNSKILNMLRDRDSLKGKCGECEYKLSCGGCRALALAAEGDFMAEDPQCWK